MRFREDGGYEGYEAYTVRADDSYLPAAVRELDEKLHVCPDMMWGCSYDYVGLKYSGLEYGERRLDLRAIYCAVLNGSLPPGIVF